jgi:hypothetical protein
MTYRTSSKRLKIRSAQGVARKAALRLERGEFEPLVDPDPYLKITVERRATGETAVFECFEGDRINNYMVYCNDEPQGIQSITEITKNIRKALPSFRRMD